MDRTYGSGLILLAGVALLGTAVAIHAILLETVVWTVVLAGAGALLVAGGAWALRTELGAVLGAPGRDRAVHPGVVGVLIALAYSRRLFPIRFDLTRAKLYSLSPSTVTMLRRLDRPVLHRSFFPRSHDAGDGSSSTSSSPSRTRASPSSSTIPC